MIKVNKLKLMKILALSIGSFISFKSTYAISWDWNTLTNNSSVNMAGVGLIGFIFILVIWTIKRSHREDRIESNLGKDAAKTAKKARHAWKENRIASKLNRMDRQLSAREIELELHERKLNQEQELLGQQITAEIQKALGLIGLDERIVAEYQSIRIMIGKYGGRYAQQYNARLQELKARHEELKSKCLDLLENIRERVHQEKKEAREEKREGGEERTDERYQQRVEKAEKRAVTRESKDVNVEGKKALPEQLPELRRKALISVAEKKLSQMEIGASKKVKHLENLRRRILRDKVKSNKDIEKYITSAIKKIKVGKDSEGARDLQIANAKQARVQAEDEADQVGQVQTIKFEAAKREIQQRKQAGLNQQTG